MKSLTPEQQAFAEEHHGLLLDFMAKHSLGDDYYDLLANRYLKVVVRYLSEEALRKYSFSTVVWYHLRSELSNYARDQVGKLQEIPIEFYCEIPAPEIAPIALCTAPLTAAAVASSIEEVSIPLRMSIAELALSKPAEIVPASP